MSIRICQLLTISVRSVCPPRFVLSFPSAPAPSLSASPPCLPCSTVREHAHKDFDNRRPTGDLRTSPRSRQVKRSSSPVLPEQWAPSFVPFPLPPPAQYKSPQACQIAKLKGCRVIAIAGGSDKCAWLLNELKVDVALDYKSKEFVKEFKKQVGYLDVYFDNVGGEILDLALSRMKQGARIARMFPPPSPPFFLC